MQRQGKTQGLPVCLHINWWEAQLCLNKDLLAEALISYNKSYWSPWMYNVCRKSQQSLSGKIFLVFHHSEETIAPITQADLLHYLQLLPPNCVLHFILVRLFLHVHAQALSHGRQRNSKPHSGEKTWGQETAGNVLSTVIPSTTPTHISLIPTAEQDHTSELI